jgi:acetoin utilization deacetylase AcuC-like enzyme
MIAVSQFRVPGEPRCRRAGRITAFGGGGYNRANLAKAWCGVLRELISA